MDFTTLLPSNLGIWPTLAIIALGGLGIRWLRDQQIEGYKTEEFHDAVERVFTRAIQTDAYRDRMRAAVGDAVSDAFEPVTSAISEHSRKIEGLDVRVTHVEVKVEGILGRMQAQRKHDLQDTGT